ncbi:MAG: MBL fold metallo-hydrolase [Candidatus Marinimicrobia bacterium]|nr:MBL fold metallo-hydrolase [Candidatus Neomarinimicrobiota bacterium]
MDIKFWGVRGSIPTPITTEQIKEKLIYLAERKPDRQLNNSEELKKFLETVSPLDFGSIGGNTACVEINIDDLTLILDMGSGMKPLGNFIEKNRENYNHIFHILLSHTHWDHISGLPFFKPAHQSDCQLRFYSPLENLKVRLEYQQDHRFFPVGFELLKAKKSFYQLKEELFQIGHTEISYLLQNHPGTSYSYRLKDNNKIAIYMTDVFLEKPNEAVIRFCQGADVLIFDSQFSREEISDKKDYGHSIGETGVDLAVAAGVRKLVLFHHDPDKTDLEIEKNLQQVKQHHQQNYSRSELDIQLAYEGMKITI